MAAILPFVIFEYCYRFESMAYALIVRLALVCIFRHPIALMILTIRTLRPVGERISLRKAPLEPSHFGGFQAQFYHSGTAALAAAIIFAKSLRRAQGDSAEVILPAYACPDLISACALAGAKPVLVDLEPNSSWMSLDQIGQKITSNTIAIIAVRFLGIPERMSDIRRYCAANQLLLIEDSAQGFPLTQPDEYWQGDVVVLSFGRGKPVNMLGGGALLYNTDRQSIAIPKPESITATPGETIRYQLKVRLYNLLINPISYGLAIRMPGIQVGETRYKHVSEIRGIPDYILNYLEVNILKYKTNPRIAKKINDMLNAQRQDTILNLPKQACFNFDNHLLRYPLLAENSKVRDRLYLALCNNGASKMYQQALPHIENIPERLMPNDNKFPNAENFAGRLLTLPTHTDVSEDLIGKFERLLQKFT